MVMRPTHSHWSSKLDMANTCESTSTLHYTPADNQDSEMLSVDRKALQDPNPKGIPKHTPDHDYQELSSEYLPIIRSTGGPTPLRIVTTIWILATLQRETYQRSRRMRRYQN
ncbi:hypothetical protein F441_08674 [Phytophthora nicotianae CJ01A1]|uniref:Uncharacterized protein n=2 Tax=Phytophthora nicotianae TaxID=4792 RepID=W2X4E7_PHYNI|nr:hypothetical protein F441_08674 [Phytophthora nicotianae CJ01A1]